MGNARRELAARRADRVGSGKAFTWTIALAASLLAGCGAGDPRASEAPATAPVPLAVSEAPAAAPAAAPAPAPGWMVAAAEVPPPGRFVLREGAQTAAGGSDQKLGSGASVKP